MKFHLSYNKKYIIVNKIVKELFVLLTFKVDTLFFIFLSLKIGNIPIINKKNHKEKKNKIREINMHFFFCPYLDESG